MTAGAEPDRPPLVLVVMDGVGIGQGDAYDAVRAARTPAMDALRAAHLSMPIGAHGPYVGLPSRSDMGNSEVGHNTMGAGRVVDQGVKRIDKAIASGQVWSGVWPSVTERCTEGGGTLHLIGLLSDGGVHSSIGHLVALLHQARACAIARIRVHVLWDGRDVADYTALDYLETLESTIESLTEAGVDCRVASGGGRMTTTMDRYAADWPMVERGWHAHVLGVGRGFPSARAAVERSRAETPGISDQLLPPFVVTDDDGQPVGPVRDGDAVILFNFRGDRMIGLARAFLEGPEFDGFVRPARPDVLLVGMTLYDGDKNLPPLRLVDPQPLTRTIGEILAANGISQLACAETQKYGHLTYFWNGNRSEKFAPALEEYVDIPSDTVPFDERPWMKSAETADVVIGALRSRGHRFIRANFAGGDMVGHTGRFGPTVLAIEAIDLALGRIVEATRSVGGILVVTADHGNAEDMVERDEQGNARLTDDGAPRWKTAHSTNPVPLMIADFGGRSALKFAPVADPGLANLAATLLVLLGITPHERFAPSLISS